VCVCVYVCLHIIRAWKEVLSEGLSKIDSASSLSDEVQDDDVTPCMMM